jgi:hypothetical protein
MSIQIGQYAFEGPYKDTSLFQNLSGVYAVLCHNNGQYNIVDIGEAGDVRNRLDTHDRKDCWKRECKGTLLFCVLYTPHKQQAGRMVIEQELRAQFKPPCGKK